MARTKCAHAPWNISMQASGYPACRACQRDRDAARRRGITITRTAIEWYGPFSKRSAGDIASARWHQNRTHKRGRGRRPVILLSPSDIQILQLLADGYTKHQTATRLGIMTTSAINSRINTIGRRLDAPGSTPRAVAVALRLGLIRADTSYRRRRRTVMRKYPVARYIREILLPQLDGTTRAYHTGPKDYPALTLLDARTPAHAVSLLYAAGKITRSDIPRKDCPGQ